MQAAKIRIRSSASIKYMEINSEPGASLLRIQDVAVRKKPSNSLDKVDNSLSLPQLMIIWNLNRTAAEF